MRPSNECCPTFEISVPEPLFEDLSSCMWGSHFVPVLVLTHWGAALVKANTGNIVSLESTSEFPGSITGTGAKVGEISDFQYCTGNYSGG